MSAAEFGLRPQTSLMSTLSRMRSEALTGSEARVRRYEASWRFLQSELDLKSAQLRLLLDLTNNMVAHVELNDLLREVALATRRLMQSDFAILGLLESESGRLRVNAFDFTDDMVLDAEAVNCIGARLAAHVFSTGKPWTGNPADFLDMDLKDDLKWAAVGFKGACILPLVTRDRVLSILALGNRERTGYTQDEVDFLAQISGQIAIAVDKALVLAELRKLKDNFGEERVCLEDEIRSEVNF